jgi:hypothetical protein
MSARERMKARAERDLLPLTTRELAAILKSLPSWVS